MRDRWQKQMDRKRHKMQKRTKTSSVPAMGVVCENIMLVLLFFYRKRRGRREVGRVRDKGGENETNTQTQS